MDATGPVRILGIAGSLRKASFNRAALRAALELVPADATLEAFELDGIPPFNQDEERSVPPRVAELKARIRAADAILIVTPEYNYGMPPALLNALNYLYVEWNYKAAGLVHYGGVSGGTRSAQVTKQSLCALKMVPLTESVTIPFVAQHIDEAGCPFHGASSLDGVVAPTDVHEAHAGPAEITRPLEVVA